MKKRKPNVILPIGMLISNIGNGMYTLAIGIILYGHTGKTSSFAFIVVLQAFLSFLTDLLRYQLFGQSYLEEL